VYVVQVTASDGAGRTTSQSINVTVTPVNDNDPVITSANTANVAENTTTVLTVTATDADLPAQTVSFSITSGADSGRFAINVATGDLTFSAAPDYETPTDADTNNIYIVQVTASDGAGRTTSQSINVTVTPVNDNDPVITSANTANVAENTTAVLTVTATDADLPPQTVSFSITGGADSGRFAINVATGELTFQTAPDYENPTDADTNNVYVVQVTASDGAGRTTSQTINVTVTGVNEAPVGNDDSATTYQDAPITLNVVSNDTDPEADTLVVSAVTQSSNGTVTFAGSSVTYTPNPGFSGADSFTYTVSDGNGGTSTATINVTVTPVVTPRSAGTATEDAALREDTGGIGYTIDPGAINDQSLQRGVANADATNMFSKSDMTPSHGSSGNVVGGFTVGMGGNDPGDEPFGRPKDNPIEEVMKAVGIDGSTRSLNQRGPLEALKDELDHGTDRIIDPFWKEPQHHASDAEAMISNESIQRELDLLKQQLEESIRPDELKEKLFVGMASGIGGTFFVGYVIWALRGASLLASALASLPLWRCFDPLPVLPTPKRRRRKHDTDRERIEKARENEEDVEELFSSVQGPRVRGDVKGTGK
jgi:VCBS repeat-containing protein